MDCSIDLSTIAEDAVFKGYRTVIKQDLRIIRHNTLYRIEVYYSPKEKKTYSATMPAEAENNYPSSGGSFSGGYPSEGSYGLNLKALIFQLIYLCDVTERKTLKFLRHTGIEISKGTLSNIIRDSGQRFIEESRRIFFNGIRRGDFHQLDSTSTKEHGRELYTHTICNDDFTYYFTTEDKKRLTLVRYLQLIDRAEDQRFLYKRSYTRRLLKKMNFPEKSIKVVQSNIHLGQVYSLKELEYAYEGFHIDNKKLFQARLFDSMAVTYYHTQKEVPKAKRLITDNANEFYLLSNQHALCWVHDARNYKKLSPVLKIHIDLYELFMQQYWDFYAMLKRFRRKPSEESIEKISEKFDEIFSQKTGYSPL